MLKRMAKLIELELSQGEERELLRGQAYGATPSHRNRCALVLLKAQGLSNEKIAAQLGVCEPSVGLWIGRFRRERLLGLVTRPGRGRKSILQKENLEVVREAVNLHRQKLSAAKAQLESELGKSFSSDTLKRFVKKTVALTSGFDGAPPKHPSRTTTRSKSNNSKRSRR